MPTKRHPNDRAERIQRDRDAAMRRTAGTKPRHAGQRAHMIQDKQRAESDAVLSRLVRFGLSA